MEQERTYPYTAWKLMPSFRPVEVTMVGRAFNHGWDSWDKSNKGQHINFNDLFPTKAEAIKNGRERLDKQQADLDKKQLAIRNRCAALDKAEG